MVPPVGWFSRAADSLPSDGRSFSIGKKLKTEGQLMSVRSPGPAHYEQDVRKQSEVRGHGTLCRWDPVNRHSIAHARIVPCQFSYWSGSPHLDLRLDASANRLYVKSYLRVLRSFFVFLPLRAQHSPSSILCCGGGQHQEEDPRLRLRRRRALERPGGRDDRGRRAQPVRVRGDPEAAEVGALSRPGRRGPGILYWLDGEWARGQDLRTMMNCSFKVVFFGNKCHLVM